MPRVKKGRTIGRNPLDGISLKKGSGRRARVKTDDGALEDIRMIVARRKPRQEPTLLDQVSAAFKRINPFA